jgi:uncharacterized membrane protein
MKRLTVLVGAALLAAAVVPSSLAAKDRYTTPTGDMRIPKSDVTSTVKFFGYTASGRTYMEIIAVRAADGTVRTAFNTCQVCYRSGRGWYTVQGDSVVCNNCGNRFKIAQIELIKGGCNPVPITPDLKTENADSVVISKDLMEEAKFLFLKWKK